jgi:hypothetical protein
MCPTFGGDLAPQGYPFYAGEFVLDTDLDLPAVEPGRRSLLAFPAFEAIVVNVTVNGRESRPISMSIGQS